MKADAYLVEQVLEKKANKEDLDKFTGSLEEIKTNKADKEKIEANNKLVKHALEEVSKDMAMKSNIKDVCKLLDLKANTK